MSKILEINNLAVSFNTGASSVEALRGICLSLEKGRTLGIVGESGSGKSVTALSIIRLLQKPAARISGGEIFFSMAAAATDLLKLNEAAMQQLRGKEIAMIFQEPMTSLNPVFRCGDQVVEAILLHQKCGPKEARQKALELFKLAKLPDPERIFDAYPHQISGGQKQRVMIAMAISCHPALLIADEPTTALDVTVQKAILELLKEIQAQTGLSMIFISHDLGVIAEVCDEVAVMERGVVVEAGPVRQVFEQPRHPYTRGLIACRPSLTTRYHRLPTIPDFEKDRQFSPRVLPEHEVAERQSKIQQQAPLISIKDLLVRYPRRKNLSGRTVQWFHAVDRVSFDIYPGEIFGLAGESGCGKTSLGRALARLTDAYSGAVYYQGKEMLGLTEQEFRPYRRDIQVVFQDPYASLNPRMSIGDAIVEPMAIHQLHAGGAARKEKAIEMLETVGLNGSHFNRYPHEFSGGQRQRICLARALVLEPRFLICDEIVSALDVSVQATILNLLLDLQEQFSLTCLFISHDLSVIRQMCNRLMVMNKGRSEALGNCERIFSAPPSEYVKQLIAAVPKERF